MIELIIVFICAFLAASILPVSSEFAVFAHYNQYPEMLVYLFLVASTGNVLGSVVNWWLGKEFLRWQHKKWFPFKTKDLVKAEVWFNQYGKFSLLLAWLPIVGDLITLGAGIAKCRFVWFLLLVSISKAGRYAILLWGLAQV